MGASNLTEYLCQISHARWDASGGWILLTPLRMLSARTQSSSAHNHPMPIWCTSSHRALPNHTAGCCSQRSPDAYRQPNYGDSNTYNKYGDHKWGRATSEHGERDLMPAAPSSRRSASPRRVGKGPKAYMDLPHHARDPFANRYDRYDRAVPAGQQQPPPPLTGELEVLIGYPKWLPPGVESVFVTAETDDGTYDRSERMHLRRGVAWSGPEGRFGGALLLICSCASKVTLHVMAHYANEHPDTPPRSIGGTTLALPSARSSSSSPSSSFASAASSQRRTTKLTAPLDIAVQLVWNATDGAWKVHGDHDRLLRPAEHSGGRGGADERRAHTGEWRVDADEYAEPYGGGGGGGGWGGGGSRGGAEYVLEPYDASESTNAEYRWQQQHRPTRGWDPEAAGHWPGGSRSGGSFPRQQSPRAHSPNYPGQQQQLQQPQRWAYREPTAGERPSSAYDYDARRRRASPRARDYSAHLLRRPPSPSPRPASTTSYSYY